MEGFSFAKHIASISQMKPSSPSVALRLIGADRADAGFVVPTTTAPRAPSSGMRRLGRLRPSLFDAKVVVAAARTGGAPGSAVVTRLPGFTFTASSTAGPHGDARDAMVGTAGAAQRTEGARLWKAATAPVSSERCATRRSMDNFRVVGGVSARCWWRETKFGVRSNAEVVFGPNGLTPARCGPVILCIRYYGGAMPSACATPARPPSVNE